MVKKECPAELLRTEAHHNMSIISIIVPIALALWVYYDARNESRSWLWVLGVLFMAPVFFTAYFWTKAPDLTWQCPSCKHENPETTQTCESCETQISSEKQKQILRGRWKLSDVVAIILVSQLVSMFILMWKLASAGGEISPNSAKEILGAVKPSTIWLSQLFAGNVILGLSLYCISSRYKRDLSEIGLKFDRPVRYFLIAIGLTMALLIIEQIFINIAIKIGEIAGTDQLKEMFEHETERQRGGWPDHITAPIFPLLFFTIVILVPISEEILFRGMAYTALKNRFGVPGGILLSALLFSLLHQMVFYFVPIFLMGLAFAYVYERTHSLLPTVFSHTLINLSAIIMVMYDQPPT